MGTISIIGIFFGKQVFALWSWGCAVVFMLIVRPFWITDLSFQLSALASLGMIVFGVSVEKTSVCNTERTHFLDFWHLIRDDLHTTLAAQTLTIPLLFFVFGRISLIAPFTNILIGWSLPFVTVLGLAIAGVGYFFYPVGQVLSWIAWIFLEYIIQIILWTARFPMASIGG